MSLPEWLAFALVLLAAAIARPGALRAPFFADDWLFLDQVRGRSLLHAITAPDPIGNFVRPVSRPGWFWLVAHLTGESAIGFHAASLAVFLVATATLFALTRRLAGTTAALFAAGFFALHAAADVPLWWACGSQDLLSVAFGLGAVYALVAGRGWIAAALFACGLLSKETLVLLPIPAMLLARRAAEPWRATIRRASPLGFGWLVWIAVVAIAVLRGRAHGAGEPLHPDALAAAVVLLARTTLGLEWRTGSPPFVPFVPPPATVAIAIALVAGAVAWGGTPRATADAPSPERPGSRALVLAGIVWGLCGAAPVVAVAPIWSAYFFLFAMAGTGLALGVALRTRRSLAALALAVLAVASHQARAMDEFQTSRESWSGASHVNVRYLRRGMDIVGSGLRDLKALHPTLPNRSTVFFAGFPPFASFQVADGPLLRGAYRDTSLRSFYISELTSERASRGRCYFILYNRQTRHLDDNSDDPEMMLRIALGCMFSGKPGVTETALGLRRPDPATEPVAKYLFALTCWDLGKRARGDSLMSAMKFSSQGSAAAFVREATQRAAAGDTLRAIAILEAVRATHIDDPDVHGVLSDLYDSNPERSSDSGVEAYAARILDPTSPRAWRRWALRQLDAERSLEARQSFERYFELDPDARQSDAPVVRVFLELERRLPGGDLAQAALRRTAQR